MSASTVGTLTLGVRMHGATLNLECDHAPLVEYAARHLAGLACEPLAAPDLRVRCHWSDADADPDRPWSDRHGSLDVIGKRMLAGASELVWLDTLRMPGLELGFRRATDAWRFDVAYRYSPKRRGSVPIEDYEHKRYFSLMSYLVYYPLIWLLGRTRGWAVLHASAIATPLGGIVIGGVGGVGKTTTCAALLARSGATLVAENLIFTDGALIYPCYEPLRLDDRALELLGGCGPRLWPMDFPEGLKKKRLFHVATPPASGIAPVALFLPRFARRRSLTPLDAEPTVEKLLAINRLTRELDDYDAYAAALDLEWPSPGRTAARHQVVTRFARTARCFELAIDRSAGLEAVVEDMLAPLGGTDGWPSDHQGTTPARSTDRATKGPRS